MLAEGLDYSKPHRTRCLFVLFLRSLGRLHPVFLRQKLSNFDFCLKMIPAEIQACPALMCCTLPAT